MPFSFFLNGREEEAVRVPAHDYLLVIERISVANECFAIRLAADNNQVVPISFSTPMRTREGVSNRITRTIKTIAITSPRAVDLYSSLCTMLLKMQP